MICFEYKDLIVIFLGGCAGAFAGGFIEAWLKFRKEQKK